MEKSVCRICLRAQASTHISDLDQNISISEKIMKCVKVNVYQDDGFPQFICYQCLKELSLCYNFVIRCEASDNILRESNSNDTLHSEVMPGYVKDEFPDEEFNEETDITHNSSSSLEVNSLKPVEKLVSRAKRKKWNQDSKLNKQCIICGLLSASESAMNIHMRRHTGEKPFRCNDCNSLFSNKGGLRRHIETFHLERKRNYICENCGKGFFTKNDVRVHMRVHTDEKPFSCHLCHKTFRQLGPLIRHKRTHTGEKPYDCPICAKKFLDRSLVKKHLLVHSDEKKFTCHLCNKSVKTRTALNTHMNIHFNPKHIVCKLCGTSVSTKGNLIVHMRRLHSEKSGQCKVCLKLVPDIAAHMRVHTGEKPFTCVICNNSFGSQRSLSNHIGFKHKNANKYKCSINDCGRTFPTSVMMEVHLLKHTNFTPHVCPQCSKGFYRISDLTKHIRKNHMSGEKLMLSTN